MVGQEDCISVALTIVKREDGGIRILSSVPGLYLAGANPRTVMADLGPALQTLLTNNENVEWLRGDHERTES